MAERRAFDHRRSSATWASGCLPREARVRGQAGVALHPRDRATLRPHLRVGFVGDGQRRLLRGLDDESMERPRRDVGAIQSAVTARDRDSARNTVLRGTFIAIAM